MVYYYIPEDFDDPNLPNCFGIPKPKESILFQDIVAHFSLNPRRAEAARAPTQDQEQGNGFIFRFKYKYQGQTSWLDMSNPNSKVPSDNGRIFMKVTRKTPKYTLPNFPEQAPAQVRAQQEQASFA
mmetsp:Transcript_13220/g.22424  ORF Transcript_13220/g.22424 Transcript_13220/m.22424 type:complete len:126 (+) Transcript_13220:81-458(+)|eukprot:CAMPEP_0168628170 /NCGR_PEP_ID=MMETSP0449_2-20121227/11696_1 /TAXON_ID=1082188 /ORGANISM="Strombidium rassoulzadegani, Strain ras09" /LENGTH=125 /DNA_ID=CAMNT_0008670561 /DNA_START=52 /DNA_END=429 /DNA_ORIENTATION=-